MLRIVTFKWGSKFSPGHVHRLRNALRRHLHMPYEFVVVTDNVDGIDADVRVVPLWKGLEHYRNCGQRLRLFAADAGKIIGGSRFGWIDLDMVVVADVTPIFDTPEEFKIIATPRPPLFYNGSLVLMNAGARTRIWTELTPAEYERRGREYGTVSDEGWIGATLGPNEATWTKADGVYYYRNHLDPAGGGLPPDARLVLMNGKRFDPALPEWQQKSPWILEHWR